VKLAKEPIEKVKDKRADALLLLTNWYIDLKASHRIEIQFHDLERPKIMRWYSMTKASSVLYEKDGLKTVLQWCEWR